MTHTTIRVSQESRDRLRDLAAADGISMSAVVERALELYRRQRFLDAVNAGYDALRADPGEWAAFRQDRDGWDATLADGALLAAEGPDRR